jgi:hypothetical protein
MAHKPMLRVEEYARALRASQNVKRAEVWNLPRCKPSELFFSCCGSVAVLALANCNEHVAEEILPHPPTPTVICTAPKFREARVIKSLHFPVQDTHARASGISCFPCQTATRNFLRFSAPPRPFSPTCPPPPGLSLHGIMHVQAGQ